MGEWDANRIVRVHWDPPRSLEATLALQNKEEDVGVYQVCGEHVVFGSGALLYIGKATNQTFGVRFEQHRRWLEQESDVLIRVGRPRKEDYRHEPPEEPEGRGGAHLGWGDWLELIGCVEALTIYWHSPPYNSAFIKAYGRKPLRVQNWGHRGRLLPEYSSVWEPERPDDSLP